MVYDQSRHTSEIYVRPSWIDAGLALSQIEKGKAEGRRTALWFRARLQARLFKLGCFLYRHPGKILFVALLVLCSFCVGLKSTIVHSRIDQLWVEVDGRLESELRYTEAALGQSESSTHQLVVQTPKEAGASLLHPGALLAHLHVLREATAVTVDLFDTTWSLKDMCQTPSIPNFDIHFIDQIFDSMIPCAIITPLDCFWEGSKLLGPEYPVAIPAGTVPKWTNLHPQNMLESMKAIHGPASFAYSTLEQHMKRAGITSGYQEKPCLDPRDRECPDSAPNKASGHLPDIGALLTGGCFGFAANYMHWPEDAIVGGPKKNKTGHIVKASALQTVIQLMGEQELFQLWSDTWKVHHVDWTQEKANQVLNTWQKRFSEEVKRQMSGKVTPSPTSPFLKNYNIYAFSTAALNYILCKFSEASFNKIAIACLLMVIYAGVSLSRLHDHIKSHSALGIAGVLLVILTIASGLGLCAMLGIPFNATTTHIIPFLMLGLGIDSMFLITYIYAEESASDANFDAQIGIIMKKAGVGMLMSSGSKILTFVAAALVPVPAVRVFAIQAAIVSLLTLGVMLVVFPAMLSLDLRRRLANRPDLFCCCLPELSPETRGVAPNKQLAVTRAVPPHHQQIITSVLDKESEGWSESTQDMLKEPKSLFSTLVGESCGWRGVGSWYSGLLVKPPVQFMAVVCIVAVMGASVWGTTKLTDGLDLTDVVPHGTVEHAFLAAQSRYFGFYNMYAVTGGDFEYPTNQRLLYEYHESFVRVHEIIKNDDGGPPQFWLGYFRNWLIELQKAFDRDWANNCITQEWWFKNASDEGILAYKLLVQTGHVDNPIDKSLVTQVRLVDKDGIINPKAFYNYLSAWTSNDALTYGASQANLRPEPKQWFHVPSDVELKIPKSAPLVYTQMPYLLQGLSNTTTIIKLIKQVRDLCKKFEERGLPNFPSGIPFLFWETYISLRQTLGIALGCALLAVFVVVSVILVNWSVAMIVTLSVAAIVLQLVGLMGMTGIQLSAVPAVMLVTSVGVSVHFTSHLCLSFLCCIGQRDHRVRMAVDHMFTPVMQGGLAILLSTGMLAFSEFEFVVRYFFFVIAALVGIGLVNGLFFLPVVLSLVGPIGEVIPLIHPNRIATPSPEPVRRLHAPKCHVPPSPRHYPLPHQCHRNHSLTTILEESSCNSQSLCDPPEPTQTIVVEPEFVVETTTCTHPHVSSSGSDSSSSSHRDTPQGSSQQHVTTTKVTATAKVKVEVHTPLSGGLEKTRRVRTHSRDSTSDSSQCSSRHS